MNNLNLKEINLTYEQETPSEILQFALEKIDLSKIALASSLSIEDQVLTDLLLKVNPKMRIFFIDTGRHFQETYDLMEETMRKYDFHYEVYGPYGKDVEALVSEMGPNSFYKSVELRKKCCEIRKVRPLNRVLGTLDAWICGLRREQSDSRSSIDVFQWDESHSLYKINPIANWSEEDLWAYIKKENVPYSELYERGFRSIGCKPCTRAVNQGEDVRSGRWWWESPEKKECGLHWDLLPEEIQ